MCDEIMPEGEYPQVVFVGQIERAHRDRGAFQEVDYRAFLGGIAKAVFEVDDTARLPEYISRAFHIAQSGRPGPVVVDVPEDEVLLAEEADKLLDDEAVTRAALEAVEQNGIVFLDEIDKVAARTDVRGGDVSREGEQRDGGHHDGYRSEEDESGPDP